MAIRASALPADIVLAFVDAIEAWSYAEHDLFMLWQLLNRTSNLGAAWAQFSDWNPSRQRQETEKAIEARITVPEIRESLIGTIERMRELSEKRNRMVHGRWQSQNVMEGSKRAGVEFLRIYDARDEPARPADEAEEHAMLGRSRFYAADLRIAEEEFRALARELHLAIPKVIPFVAARIR